MIWGVGRKSRQIKKLKGLLHITTFCVRSKGHLKKKNNFAFRSSITTPKIFYDHLHWFDRLCPLCDCPNGNQYQSLSCVAVTFSAFTPGAWGSIPARVRLTKLLQKFRVPSQEGISLTMPSWQGIVSLQCPRGHLR